MKNLVSPKRYSSSVLDGVGRGCLNGVRGGDEEQLPDRESILSLWQYVGGVLTESIGLSVSDYLLVPAELRDHFFISATEMRTPEEMLWRIKRSPYLNISELVGRSQKGFALYPEGTAETTLQKACRYHDTIYGVLLDINIDGETVWNGYNMGAY